MKKKCLKSTTIHSETAIVTDCRLFYNNTGSEQKGVLQMRCGCIMLPGGCCSSVKCILMKDTQYFQLILNAADCVESFRI